jgi:hypothetical protein
VELARQRGLLPAVGRLLVVRLEAADEVEDGRVEDRIELGELDAAEEEGTG